MIDQRRVGLVGTGASYSAILCEFFATFVVQSPAETAKEAAKLGKGKSENGLGEQVVFELPV